MSLIPKAYRNMLEHKYNPNYRNLTYYKDMLTKDSMVVYGYDFVRRGVISRIGEYSNDNPDIKAYVDDFVMPAIRKSLPFILSSIYWGVSVSELIKKPLDDMVVLDKIYTATPDLWWGSEAFIEDDMHNIKEVKFLSGAVPIYDNRGIQQLAVYTYRPEYSEYWGFASATSIYPYWYVKSRLMAMYAIYLEKNCSPAVVISADGNDDDRIQEQWRNSGTSPILVVHEGSDVKILESTHDAGEEFKQGIEMMDKYILLCYYIPKLVADEGIYSTRAQSQTHLDVYLKTEKNLVNNIIEFLIENIIQPMVLLNFGPQDFYGNIMTLQESDTSIVEWSNIIKNLRDVELFDAGLEEHLRWASDKFGLEIPEDTSVSLNLSNT